MGITLTVDWGANAANESLGLPKRSAASRNVMGLTNRGASPPSVSQPPAIPPGQGFQETDMKRNTLMSGAADETKPQS